MANKTLPDEFYKLMEELQETDFVVVELQLYLDTHPKDLDAVKQYNTFAKRSHEIRNEIEQKFGPLMQFGQSFSPYPWAWSDTPWPWQL